jgi:hypothetical protein
MQKKENINTRIEINIAHFGNELNSVRKTAHKYVAGFKLSDEIKRKKRESMVNA